MVIPKTRKGIGAGTLNPTSPDKYYKGLASNLRGRVLQLFPKLPAGTVEDQDPAAETLFCLVGKEGLFCGMQSPRACNGLYTGGSKFIDQDAPDTISRAGAKIAEALHHLLLHRPPLPEGGHWRRSSSPQGEMWPQAASIASVDFLRRSGRKRLGDRGRQTSSFFRYRGKRWMQDAH